MQTALGLIMISNAALFFFGALQHAGISVGNFHEPRILPAFIVEIIGGLFLLLGGIAIFGHLSSYWTIALTGNLVALAGILLGVVALAMGGGPRTASNDLYHRIMLLLIGVSLLFVVLRQTSLAPKVKLQFVSFGLKRMRSRSRLSSSQSVLKAKATGVLQQTTIPREPRACRTSSPHEDSDRGGE